MLKAKSGKLVELSSSDQQLFWEAYLDGGKHLVYRLSYGQINKAHAILISDSEGHEVCSLISKDVTRLVALSGDKLLGTGMEIEDFIREYCPLYKDDLDEMELDEMKRKKP